MPAYARKGTGGTFQPVEVGSHIAVCFSLIDLGIQGGGKFEAKPKVAISFQFPGQLTDDGKPKVITQQYTNSMNKKANLRKTVETWFGKSFPSDKAAEEFDLSLLLGRACLANVIHKDGGEKTFANINAIMPIPAGFPKPERPTNTVYYWPSDTSQTPDQVSRAYAEIPSWLREKVDSQLPEATDTGVANSIAKAASAPLSDDDIPF